MKRGVSAEEIKTWRFISERGSQINDVLFGDRHLPGADFCLIVESRFDAMALASMGIAAVVSRWNFPELADVPEKIVIPDNDGGRGDLIAIDRMEKIPGCRLHRLPSQYKDVGELIQAEGRDGVTNWLRLWPKEKQ